MKEQGIGNGGSPSPADFSLEKVSCRPDWRATKGPECGRGRPHDSRRDAGGTLQSAGEDARTTAGGTPAVHWCCRGTTNIPALL